MSWKWKGYLCVARSEVFEISGCFYCESVIYAYSLLGVGYVFGCVDSGKVIFE